MVTRISRQAGSLFRQLACARCTPHILGASAAAAPRFMSAAPAASAAAGAAAEAASAASTAAAAPAPAVPGTSTLEALGQMLTPAPSNGTPLPGIPYDRLYPDFNLVVSSLEDGTAKYSLQLLDYLHGLGYEWWAAAAVLTLGMRMMTMPLIFASIKTGARFQDNQEGMARFQDMIAAAKAKQDQAMLMKAAQDLKAFMAEKKLKFRYMFMPVLVQMPLILNLFQGMRSFAGQAHLIAGAAAGVPLYAALGLHTPVYMHLPDPYYILPAIQTVLAVAAVRMNNNVVGVPQAGLTPAGMRLLFSGLTTVFGVITVNFPAILQLSFATTSATMVLQQALLRIKPFRDVLGFPSSWPASPEVIIERARRQARQIEGNPMMETMKTFEPFFKRISNIAAGHYAGFGAEPRHAYVTIMRGLHDPGAPPPPAVAPPVSPKLAAAAASGTAAAEAAAQAVVGSGKVDVAAGPKLYRSNPKKAKGGKGGDGYTSS